MMEEHQHCPNFSLRMTNLTALLVVEQIPLLTEKIRLFNRHYDILAAKLGNYINKYVALESKPFTSA